MVKKKIIVESDMVNILKLREIITHFRNSKQRKTVGLDRIVINATAQRTCAVNIKFCNANANKEYFI